MENKIIKFKEYLIRNEKSENTIYKYVNDIKYFFKWLSYNQSNYDNDVYLTVEKLLKFKQYLINNKFKISTINSKISSLNSYFSFHKKDNLKLKIMKYQKSVFSDNITQLSKKELNKLYTACGNNEKMKLLLETIVSTGIRVSEIKFITKDSVKMSKTIINNKGKVREILIPRNLSKKLEEYHYKNEIKTDMIFSTKNGTAINRKQIWQMLKNLSKKAGVSLEKVYPHNLRHLFAREFYKKTKIYYDLK